MRFCTQRLLRMKRIAPHTYPHRLRINMPASRAGAPKFTYNIIYCARVRIVRIARSRAATLAARISLKLCNAAGSFTQPGPGLAAGNLLQGCVGRHPPWPALVGGAAARGLRAAGGARMVAQRDVAVAAAAAGVGALLFCCAPQWSTRQEPPQDAAAAAAPPSGGQGSRPRRVLLALGVKVILMPPCIFH